ncbi:YihY/virulence factor BrkB family protein [Oceanitalea stevensii]|uniref:YihY/virulence factor BrkB family protein n=1 Tax=Oceanitalea stevensii TaxID=2763072 RepID=A0ABR8YZP5_9MICO|nr:YihY/virulence factor BrkB family protein [Oceanitalea stevensii]MBD8061500.1 YihY/virulence factor BrkB family protein [Oceanitalea stevensii]
MSTAAEGRPSLGERLTALMARWEHSRPGRGLARYAKANGGLLAGGITYSALFSIFAALTIGYTVFMTVLGNNAELRETVLQSVDDALPGIIDTGSNGGMINPDSLVLETALNPASIAAVGVLLWTAISVMGALKRSIRMMFGIVAPKESPVLTRVRDLGGFLILALAVVTTAALGIAAGVAGQWLLDTVGIEGTFAAVALRVLGYVVALLVDGAVYVLLFRVLAGVHVPRRDLLVGALLGAVASTVLRLFGTTLVGGPDNPLLATAAALITLLLWVNLLARVTLMIAAWTANPPAPPKPDEPGATNFDEHPNYVTLSVPRTLTWDYEATTGTVQAPEKLREEALVADLEHLGEEGEEVLAQRHAEDEQDGWNERMAVEARAREAYWGGLVGRVREWNRRRLGRRHETKDAYADRSARRRKARGETRHREP